MILDELFCQIMQNRLTSSFLFVLPSEGLKTAQVVGNLDEFLQTLNENDILLRT